MENKKQEEILGDAGDNIRYCDLFIACAQSASKANGKEIPQWIIDVFYEEVAKYRTNWERRVESSGKCIWR